MKKTILVTGGAGFIGSNFIKYIHNKYPSYQIINLDKLTYAGSLENLQDMKGVPNYLFVKGDIGDRKMVQDLLAEHEVDYVVNFAAESHVDRSIEDPEIFVKTNVLGTQALLDAVKNAWQEGTDQEGYPSYKPGKKYLQISTDEVYGALEETGFFREDSPLAPNSPYSASKAGADLLVRAYTKTYRLPTNITRCSNNYGPFQFPEKLIPFFILRAWKEMSLPLYGDGLQVRDWLHVMDHCHAIDLVLHQGKIGEVYHVGGNNERTNLEIANMILKKLGKTEAFISYIEDRLGHDRRYALDCSKIITELGWTPNHSFEEGIGDTIDWYLHNPNWIKKIENRQSLC